MEQRWINPPFYDQWMYRILIGLAFTSNISTGASSVLVALGILLVLVQAVRTRTFPALDTGMLKAVLIYLGIWIICGLASREPNISVAAVGSTAHRILPVFLALLCVRSKKQIGGIILAFSLSVCINNITAFAQLYTHGIMWRPSGFVHTPTFLASHLLMAIPVFCFFAQQEYMRRFQRPLLALAALSGVLLVLTQTRGAWLAAAGTLLLLFVLAPKLRRLLLIAGVIGTLLLGTVLAFSPMYASRFSSISDTKHTSNRERIYMWQAAIEIFQDYPILGVGMEEYGYYYNAIYIPDAAVERPTNPNDPKTGHTQPHNNFLQHLAEGGIFGAAAFLILHGYLLCRLWRQFRMERKKGLPSYALMGLLIFAGIHLEGLTDTNVNQVSIGREYCLLMGLILAAGKMGQQLEDKPHNAQI